MANAGLIVDGDGRATCPWHANLADYRAYHDHEWGRPVADDQRLFEKICLEGFQAGLSWLTILRRRDAFRRAFADFDPAAVAGYGPTDIDRLVTDAGIIRHRGKIESVVNNARRALALMSEAGSIAAFVWRYEPTAAERPRQLDHATLMTMAKTPSSERLSKDLKRRGWSFVGPTTIYAFMQAVGLVNDHIDGCWCRPEVEQARSAFQRPA